MLPPLAPKGLGLGVAAPKPEDACCCECPEDELPIELLLLLVPKPYEDVAGADVWAKVDAPAEEEAGPTPSLPLYTVATAPLGSSFFNASNPPSNTFLNRVALGTPTGLTSNLCTKSFLIVLNSCSNSAGYLFASMCPAPVRNATRQGAVSNGSGVAGGSGRRPKNRCNHVSAPACPPSRVWSVGCDDIMSAIMEMRPW